MLVPVNEIKIPWYFTQTPPGKEKLYKHIVYFNEHNEFLNPTVLGVDSQTLVDGYVNYLIAIQNDIHFLDCRIQDIKRKKKCNNHICTKRKRNIRKLLLKIFNNRCASCGRTLQADNPDNKETYVTIDHVIALSKGGINYISNMQPLCKRCNELKANMLPEEFEKIYGGNLKFRAGVLQI